jgi:branched-chain amino acid transport system permease protein
LQIAPELRRRAALYGPALTVAVVATVVTVVVQADRTMLDTLVLMAIYALLALSVGIAYGQAGVLSLAQGSFALAGAYITGICAINYELSPWVGLVGAVVIPVCVAYVIGRLVVRLSHLALVIATLFVGQIIVLLLAQGGDFTGGNVGLIGIPYVTGFEGGPAYCLLAWGIVAIVLYGYARLRSTAEGRSLNTLRTDAVRARADGVAGAHALAKVFALSAGLAAVSGWLYAHYFAFVDPTSLGTGWSIIALLMAVVGGLRMTLGPVIGAVLLTMIDQAVPGSTGTIVYGSALVVVLIAAPRGILGTAADILARLSRPAHRPVPDDAPTPASDAGAQPVVTPSADGVTR